MNLIYRIYVHCSRI